MFVWSVGMHKEYDDKPFVGVNPFETVKGVPEVTIVEASMLVSCRKHENDIPGTSVTLIVKFVNES